MRKPSRAAGRPSRAPSCRGSEGIEYPLADRLHRIERLRDIGEQDLRIVVGFVDRHPGEGLAVALGPLGQDGRLPVAGRRDHRGDRTTVTPLEPLDKRRTTHRPGPKQGTVKLAVKRSNAGPSAPSEAQFAGAARCRPMPGGLPWNCVPFQDRPHLESGQERQSEQKPRPAPNAARRRQAGRRLGNAATCPPIRNLGGLAGWRCWRPRILPCRGTPLIRPWADAGLRWRRTQRSRPLPAMISLTTMG